MTAGIRRATADRRILAVRAGRAVERPDVVVTEEPMEIRVAAAGQTSRPIAVTMRTPGHDFELAAGFVLAEGLALPTQIRTIRYCVDLDRVEQRYNTVTVDLATDRPLPDPVRTAPVSSACGVCGSTSLDAVAARIAPVAAGDRVAGSVLLALPDRLRREQAVFSRTGGLHGAGLFRLDGALLAVREDVGRHNAVDKAVGWAALQGRLPLGGHVLAVSGRIGFEIAQKAAMAGVPVVAAVSAPSSLAVSVADRLGVTLVGFLRGDSYNVYTHPDRLDLDR